MTNDVIVSREEKATRAGGRITDCVIGGRLDAIDDGLDEFTRREVLAGSFG